MTTKSSLSDKLRGLKKSKEFQKKSNHYKRMIILGEKIYGRRKDLELSQSELAKKTGVTQRIISELENGTYASAYGISEDLYDRLAQALQIDRDYLFSDKIDRRTFELFAYLYQKTGGKMDIMQFMKLPYFVDLAAVKDLGHPISNFSYIRWEYGPFDKNIYAYRPLFEEKKQKVKFSYISDFLESVDRAIKSLPINNGEQLKKRSYKTGPMKKLGATEQNKVGWGKRLNLSCGF